MKLYVAGPMRGYPEFNFPLFHGIAHMLRDGGHEVVNPAEHDREVYPDMKTWPGYADGDLAGCPDFDLTAAMAWDLEQLLTCDGIVMLPGWEASSGAQHELATARVTGKRLWHVYEWSPNCWRMEPLADAKQEDDEVRVVDPTTGGAKGQKLARFDLLPAGPLTQVAEHYGRGARKYEDRNWERGYAWSLSFGAMQRHAWAFWHGEDADPETGSHHLAAVAFHALALMEFGATHPEMDDRPTTLGDS